MAKMNMGAVASKLGGMTAGIMVGGIAANYLKKNNLNPLYASLGMIAAGVYAPSLMGGAGKDSFAQHAGDALIVKGLNTFLVDKLSFIAGPEDEVSGPYGDDSVSGYAAADENIVSGYGQEQVSGYGDDHSVAGLIH